MSVKGSVRNPSLMAAVTKRLNMLTVDIITQPLMALAALRDLLTAPSPTLSPPPAWLAQLKKSEIIMKGVKISLKENNKKKTKKKTQVNFQWQYYIFGPILCSGFISCLKI